jgi:hypothetical protein
VELPGIQMPAQPGRQAIPDLTPESCASSGCQVITIRIVWRDIRMESGNFLQITIRLLWVQFGRGSREVRPLRPRVEADKASGDLFGAC